MIQRNVPVSIQVKLFINTENNQFERLCLQYLIMEVYGARHCIRMSENNFKCVTLSVQHYKNM